MDPNSSVVLFALLVLWVIGWGALLISIWVLTELLELRDDEKRLIHLEHQTKNIETRLDAIEKFLMKSGYYPPHKK